MDHPNNAYTKKNTRRYEKLFKKTKLATEKNVTSFAKNDSEMKREIKILLRFSLFFLTFHFVIFFFFCVLQIFPFTYLWKLFNLKWNIRFGVDKSKKTDKFKLDINICKKTKRNNIKKCKLIFCFLSLRNTNLKS
jgi:hypothetical protein